MKNKISFKEFIYDSVEATSFLQLPKVLLNNEYFKELSIDCIVLYSLLLDCHKLSTKNNWIDDEGRVFVQISMSKISQKLRCGKDKTIKLLRQLSEDEGIGLIQIKSMGQGKTNRIYVNNFNNPALYNDKTLKDYQEDDITDISEEEEKEKNDNNDNGGSLKKRLVGKTDYSKKIDWSEKPTSKWSEKPTGVVGKTDTSKTIYNKTIYNKTKYVYTNKNNLETKDTHTLSLINAWNDLPNNINKISGSDLDTKDFECLLEKYNISHILKAINQINDSSLLLGKIYDWCVDFKWFCSPDNFENILNNKYKDYANSYNKQENKTIDQENKANTKKYFSRITNKYYTTLAQRYRAESMLEYKKQEENQKKDQEINFNYAKSNNNICMGYSHLV